MRQLQSKFQKLAKIKEVAKHSTNLWHRRKKVHSEAFKSVCSLVENEVITGDNVLGLKDAFSNYVSILEDMNAENLVSSCTTQNLEEKLNYISKNV